MPEQLLDARAAAALVRSGDSVYVNGAAGYPVEFVHALVTAPDRPRVTLQMPMRAVEIDPAEDYAAPAYDGGIRVVTDFSADNAMREAVRRGVAHYRPTHTGETARALPHDLDWLVFRSPGLAGGAFNLGPFPACVKDLIARARHVIVEVNPALATVLGDNFVGADDVDYVFDATTTTTGLVAPRSEPSDDVTALIARTVADLVPNGATIQFGIGALPGSVATDLTNHEGLGIHSEMFGDPMMRLVKDGVVTNENKEIDCHKSVAALALGSEELYAFIDRNPAITFAAISTVNDPARIALNDHHVSINTAIQVDLLGQVASETIGPTHYSGSGGQWQFHRGALLSRGGKGVIALRSVSIRSGASRIVAGLERGTAVTIPRNDADIVVTEHGVAQLRGRDMGERAAALIRIAAPRFREELASEARRLYGLRIDLGRDQKEPA